MAGSLASPAPDAVFESVGQTLDTITAQTVTRTSTEDDIWIAAQNSSRKGPLSLADISQSDLPSEQKALLRIYRSNLLKKTYQHVVYPDSAIDNNHEGDVVIKIVINRSGEVQSVSFDSRARYNSLNKAASRAIKKAKPYPPVPQYLDGETFEILMPIRFRLTG